ncbi:hypothetical protein K9N50_01700 [bacterium]|nr:hypothetical protein [bacterium]
MKQQRKTNKELRKFGLVMTVPLAIIGGLLFWREKPAAPYFIGLATFFLITGLAVPIVLLPIEKAWMALAKVLSIVVTYFLLTVTFFVMITPMALLLKLIRKDLLSLKFTSNPGTYWVKVDPDGPASRIDKPY